MVRVSVIIPAYNSGKYIDQAVSSVIEQTFTDWECVIIDDGSKEDFARLTQLDKRVRVIRQTNAGVAVARNRGIAQSKGEFIAFLDHDDLFLPTKLERQVHMMEHDPKLGLIHSHFTIIDENGRQIGTQSPNTSVDFLTMLEYGAPYPTNTMLRRSVIDTVGVFDPFFTPSEDQEFFIKVAKYFGVGFIPSVEAAYRVHGSNTSKNYMACYNTMKNLSDRHRVCAAIRGDLETQRSAIAMMVYRRKQVFGPQAYDAARNALRQRKVVEFLTHLSRAIVWSPQYTTHALMRYLIGYGKSHS